MRPLRLVKAQAASLAGTVVDFLVTIFCVEILHSWILLATVLGNTAGGITNFYLGRYFVFKAAEQNRDTQGFRYFLVWLGSMLLNAAGVYLFTKVLHANYVQSKVVVSLVVGICFNYFLQLHFVFKKS
ncbi:GtrA family protein [Hymenobacter ginkgonis]|uniref:GtrA family protein n=1 Tax=Hymenobacter ginkgonis TaxID=2682976 RepID=UPI0018DAF8D7|nr:GtrA family protein [Hymenobacter ginkgonis]